MSVRGTKKQGENMKIKRASRPASRGDPMKIKTQIKAGPTATNW
jgi:hypothetical protein